MSEFGSFIRAEIEAIEAFRIRESNLGMQLSLSEAAAIWVEYYEEDFKRNYTGESSGKQLPA